MHGRRDRWPQPGGLQLAVLLSDAEEAADERLCGCRPQAHDGPRFDALELRVQPRAAGVDLLALRLLMDAPLAARLPPEVLHHVGDVDGPASDSRIVEGSIEQLTGRTDKGRAGLVLAIAWLLPDEHQPRALRTFAEDGLGRVAIEVAGLAASRRPAQLVEAARFGGTGAGG